MEHTARSEKCRLDKEEIEVDVICCCQCAHAASQVATIVGDALRHARERRSAGCPGEQIALGPPVTTKLNVSHELQVDLRSDIPRATRKAEVLIRTTLDGIVEVRLPVPWLSFHVLCSGVKYFHESTARHVLCSDVKIFS